MKLVFATHNDNKLIEVRKMINPKIQLLSLNDIGFDKPILENGLSLEENAVLKAEEVYESCGLPCFADDTGLLINCLGDNPGVRSARFAGEDCNSENNIKKVLDMMISCSDRKARFETVVCYKTNNEKKLFKGVTHGEILRQKVGDGGFGYDPIFMPESEDHSYAEMSLEEKNKISHRFKAIKELTKYLNSVTY